MNFLFNNHGVHVVCDCVRNMFAGCVSLYFPSLLTTNTSSLPPSTHSHTHTATGAPPLAMFSHRVPVEVVSCQGHQRSPLLHLAGTPHTSTSFLSPLHIGCHPPSSKAATFFFFYIIHWDSYPWLFSKLLDSLRKLEVFLLSVPPPTPTRPPKKRKTNMTLLSYLYLAIGTIPTWTQRLSF